MGNFTSFQISTDTARDAQAAAEHDVQTHKNARQTEPTVQIGGKRTQVDTFGEGRVAVSQTSRGVTGHAAQPLRPGHVMIPGFGETTIEAARAAGVLPPGFNEPAGNNSATKATPAGNTTTTKQDGSAPASDKAASAAPDATDEAAKAIETLTGSLGGDAVSDGIWNAAETGDIEADIPEGVTPAQVETLVTGFTAQANAALGAMPSGAVSVEMLVATLSDSELREARFATITNDPVKLQHLGAKALAAMEQLPYANPAAFDDLIADMPPAERKALSFNEEQKAWVVTVPGRQPMSFGAAVRAGIVRVG